MVRPVHEANLRWNNFPAKCWPLTFAAFSAVAMKAMNKVASHINEMQKIHEEFGAVFDQLIIEQSGEKKEVRVRGGEPLTMPLKDRDLQSYWLMLFSRPGCRPVDGRPAAPHQRDLAQPSCVLGEMEEGAAASGIWYVASSLNSDVTDARESQW